jgi:hypothetical protein
MASDNVILERLPQPLNNESPIYFNLGGSRTFLSMEQSSKAAESISETLPGIEMDTKSVRWKAFRRIRSTPSGML